MAVQNLTPLAVRVLRLIRDRGLVRGSELLNRFSAIPPEEVSAAVKELVSNEILNVKGDYTPDTLAEAYLSCRPSTSAAADFAIRSA
jgi:hypothetical protein